MADIDIRDFKSALDGIKSELGSLQESIASIDDCIKSSQLVSEDMVQNLSEVLNRYKDQYAALRNAGKRISITIGVDINEIEEALQVYEAKHFSSQLREIVLDYFRLTAETARVRTSLEESKKTLMEKCLLPINELSSEIRAYEIVVENARDPKEELPEPDYLLIEDTFGTRIAEASDNRRLVIDASADLSLYLNGSSDLLMPLDTSAPEIPRVIDSPISNADIHDASNENSISDDSSEETSEVFPLWPNYQGYVDKATVNLTTSNTSAPLSASKIKALVDAHPELPYVFSTIANEKLILPFDRLDQTRYDYIPLPQFVDTLFEQGFMSYLEVTFNEQKKKYLTFSDKGWECLLNKEIYDILAENAPYFAVPEDIQIHHWTNTSAYRTSVICDYMNTAKITGCVVQIPETSISFAFAGKNNNPGNMITTALLEKGKEIEDIAWLLTSITSCKETQAESCIILLQSEEDISYIRNALDLSEELEALVEYVVISDISVVYDGKGNRIKSSSEESKDQQANDTVSIPDSQPQTISPRFLPKGSLKLPSKQEFDALLKRYSPVSGYVFDRVSISLMFTKDQMQAELGNTHEDINVAMLHELESKGYIAAYVYENETYYVATKLLAECAQKDQLRRVYKSKYPKMSDLCAPIVIGTIDSPLDDFIKYAALSKLYWDLHIKIINSDALVACLKTTMWDHSKERHYLRLTRKGCPAKKLLVVSQEEFINVATDVEKGYICSAEKLPLLHSNTPDTYFCVTDTLYVWDGEHWSSVFDDKVVSENEYEHNDVSTEHQSGDDSVFFDGNQSTDQIESHNRDIVDHDNTETSNEASANNLMITVVENSKPDTDEYAEFESIMTLDSKGIATYLLERNIDPNAIDMFLLLVEKLIESNIQIIDEDVVVNTLSQAIVLLKALSQTDPIYRISYQRVLWAMDSQLQTHAYTGSALNGIFNDTPAGAFNKPVLKLMAYIRAMFAHENAYDYELNTTTKGAFEHFEDNFPGLDIVKPLYNSLLKVNKYLPNGFSIPVLRRFGDEKAQKNQMLQISRRANDLIQVPTVKSGLKAMIPMLNRCFGPESDFSECMRIVSSNAICDRDVVRLMFEDFCEPNNSGELMVSENLIVEMFDENWKKAIEEIHGPRDLIASQKNKVLDNIRERLELMDQWLQITNGDEASLGNWSSIQSLRSEILGQIDHIEKENFGSCSAFDVAIIAACINGIRKKLQGKFIPDSTEFVDLLRTGIFCLDERGIPHLDEAYVRVRYYEPWRNMLRHIASPITGLHATLEAISDSTNLPLFDNLGQAIQICAYLNENCNYSLQFDQYEQDIESGKKKAQSDAEKFKGELEMAFAYGRITEQFKEDIQSILEHAVYSFSDFSNFACLRVLIDALRSMIDDEASSAVERLTQEINDRIAKQPDENLLKMLEMAREKLNEPERNYAVAEEYINRFDAGVTDCLGLSETKTPNVFLQFINDEIDHLCELCKKNKNNTLKRFGADYVTKVLDKKKMSAQYKGSALSLIQSMPNRPDEVKSGSSIATLLREIGFDVTNIRQTHGATVGNTMVRLAVDVKPDAKDKSEYAHPVDIMGTKLGSPLDVICLFGSMQPNDIVDKVCKLELNRTAIVLLNGPVDVASRRQIAERFHREKSGRNPFLLIDWVLLLYLATYQKTERMAVMLSCTLPYTSSFKPFVIKGAVPDEMFIGRKRELNRLLDPNGPSIVYGGRQLGKTALLERALSLANHPDRREFAVLVRAASFHTEAELVQALVIELNMHKLGIANSITSMNELCTSLKKKYQEGKWTKILAMVDEADIILNNFRAMDPVYKPIIPLSDLCRSTSNNFKFVLAGLHNVCRAATDPNTIFGQLGGALCIKPLNASDAYELLSRPLRYMGFKIEADKLEHILVNTSFYPGIIHHVGYSLVENLSTKYAEYYSASHKNPPYDLTDKQLGEIMSGDALNEKINERIRWTLEVDPRYFMIARCIAYLDCEDPGENNKSHSVDDIMEYAELLGISSLEGLKKTDFEGLLKELVEMGILVPQTESTYRLRQRRFLEAIGTSCEKIENDIRMAEGV